MSDKLLKKLTSLPAAIFVFTMIVSVAVYTGSYAQLFVDRSVFELTSKSGQGVMYLQLLWEVLIPVIMVWFATGLAHLANKFVFDRPRITETVLIGMLSFYLFRSLGTYIPAWWVGPLLTFSIIGMTMYVYQRLIVRKL